MIFDCILGPTLNDLSYVCPAIANTPVSLYQLRLLVFAPSFSLDVRSQLVVPPLATLFANTSRKVLGNHTPVPFPMLRDKPGQQLELEYISMHALRAEATT